MRVRVYRNLRNGKLTVQEYIKGKGWRVLKHVDHIYLKDADFSVSQAGRERVLREKQKNVHAYITGQPCTYPGAATYKIALWRESPGKVQFVTYNPYKYMQFYDRETQEPIHTAHVAYVHASGLICIKQPIKE